MTVNPPVSAHLDTLSLRFHIGYTAPNCTTPHRRGAVAQQTTSEISNMASIFRAGKRWRAQIRRAGLPALSEYFDTKQDAQRWARGQEADIDRGRAAVDGLRVTVRDVLDAYDAAFPSKVNKNRTHARRTLEPWFGGIRLDELGAQAVINFATVRAREGAGPSTILNNLSYLRSYLAFGTQVLGAVDAGAMAKARIASAVSLLAHNGQVAPSNERTRRPSDEEMEILHELFAGYGATRCDGVPMWDMILFAIATTMRLGEIVKLERRVLDVNARTIMIRDRKDPRRKKGNDEVVPLLKGPFKFRGAVVDPMEILLRQPPGPVFFPVRTNTVSTIFGRLVAGRIDDLHFHDFRHDGISRMFSYGFDIPRVALVSGHKNWKSLARYTQLRPEELHSFTGG